MAFGIACLIASVVVLYGAMDNVYLTEAMTYAPTLVTITPDSLNRVFQFRKLATVSLISSWMAMMSVKFSFLALFRRLIDRMPRLIRYWWIVVIFNIAVTGYGASVYVIACPHFSGAKVGEELWPFQISRPADCCGVQCLGGATRRKTIRYSISQLVLDVFGDLLSKKSSHEYQKSGTDWSGVLYIPVHLIWKVKIKLLQKVALSFSLCLTVVVIIFTVTRAIGLEWKDKLDVAWEIYFQILAAEVGLILVSMTAFRTLFVSRSPGQHGLSPKKTPTFWKKSKTSLRNLFDLRRWTLNYSKRVSKGQRPESMIETFGLPSIPNGGMTGVQTFIGRQEVADSDLEAGNKTTRKWWGVWAFAKHVLTNRNMFLYTD